MALNHSKLAAATAVAAAVSMLAAAPAEARERWGRGHHHHRDTVDAGDILAGVLILGGIAAIASAASQEAREERYPRPWPDEDARYGRPEVAPRFESRGIERAVDMCVGEVEQGDERVDSVEVARRTAEGWHVSGVLADGAGFSCAIGNDGRIGDVQIGGASHGYGHGVAPAEPVADGQWSDEAYARARAAQDEPAQSEDDGRYTAATAPDFGA